MSPHLRRRALLGGVAVSLAGCTADTTGGDEQASPNESTSSDDTDDARSQHGSDPPPGCDLDRLTEQGRADPIETTVRADQFDDPPERCAMEAARAALAHADGRLDLSLGDADWINGSYVDDGEITARVSVRVMKDSGDGTYHQCPDPAYDAEELLDVLPSEVTVTLAADGDERHRCVHDISLEQTTYFLD